MESTTVAELLIRAVNAHSARSAFVVCRNGGAMQVTFREFGSRAGHLSTRMGRGGSPVAIALRDPVDLAAAFCAAALSGRSAVLVDAELDAPSLAAQFWHAQVSTIIVDNGRADDLRAAWKASHPQADEPEYIVPDSAQSGAARLVAPTGQKSTDPAAIVYTSGSTGTPKGVVLSHAAMLRAGEGVIGSARIDASFRGLSLAPFSHAAGMHALIILLAVGGRLVIPASRKPNAILQAIQPEGVTHLLAPPVFYEAIAKRAFDGLSATRGFAGRFGRSVFALLERTADVAPRATRRVGRLVFRSVHAPFGPSLSVLFSAGASLRPKVSRTLVAFGFDLRDAYGLTETAGVICLTDDRSGLRPGHIGPLLPGVSIEVRDANARGEGELWVRSDQVMLGYHRQAEPAPHVLAEGWLRTGDVGRIENGRLVLCARTKEIIVTSAGKNVYPDDVEAAFSLVEGVAELCAFAVPADAGECVGLAVVPCEGVSVQDLQRTLAERNTHLPSYQRVQRFFFRSEPLPRTVLRKVSRTALAAELSAAPRLATHAARGHA